MLDHIVQVRGMQVEIDEAKRAYKKAVLVGVVLGLALVVALVGYYPLVMLL